MSWFRLAQADYPEELRVSIFAEEGDTRRPTAIALETSQNKREPDAINVVYYFDIETGEECGDFFFESIDEAVNWCADKLKIARESFEFFEPFRDID